MNNRKAPRWKNQHHGFEYQVNLLTMNLNDPFSRLSKKQQNEYLTLRQSLKDSSVIHVEDAQVLLNNIYNRAKIYTIAVVAIALIMVFFMPQLKAMVIVFSLLILLWIFATTLKGHRYIKRYISELVSTQAE